MAERPRGIPSTRCNASQRSLLKNLACWIVHGVANDSPCVGCFSAPDDPNRGGPLPRHNQRSNNAFVDGHIEAQKPAQWYWARTPWLMPQFGDQ
ncbi:MAG TPA: hypothetical protein VL361_01520 [Candidatus Limnocylindrales bacterium]|nr:hypothetical protein [Candidatus Limnocylindrales bacterium]